MRLYAEKIATVMEGHVRQQQHLVVPIVNVYLATLEITVVTVSCKDRQKI